MNDPRVQIEAYCRDSDHEAFRWFYREQSPKLWKFLIARGCDRDTAYDLLAEAFLRFIQNACRDTRAPVALLYRIALNLRIDAARRERVSPVVAMADPPDAGADSESDEQAHIRVLLSRLGESEQNLLLLRYWIGLSHDEVATALDMPAGTVRRQCAEALARLRGMLDEP